MTEQELVASGKASQGRIVPWIYNRFPNNKPMRVFLMLSFLMFAIGCLLFIAFSIWFVAGGLFAATTAICCSTQFVQTHTDTIIVVSKTIGVVAVAMWLMLNLWSVYKKETKKE